MKTELLKSGIETYTGRPVMDLKRHDDPVVEGAVALRATMKGGETIDFLVSANVGELKTPDSVADVLEECEFTTWPPRSGRPRFF